MSASATEQDVIWMDVLPSMNKFFPMLAKGSDQAAEKAGKSAGAKFGKAFALGTVALGGAAVAIGKQLYNLGETFDDVADTIRVGTGATGKNLDALVASAKNVGTQVPAAWEDIGVAVADVNTRLGLTGPTLEKVSGQFLELGRLTGEKIDIKKTTAALSAFGIEGEAVSGSLDHLYQVSQASGVGVNELATKLGTNGAVIKQLGLSFGEAAVLVGGLDKAGINSNAVMASMGRSMTALAKKGEDPKKAFARVTGELEALVKQGKDADAVNLAGKVFGTRGAPQMIAALKSGSLSFKDLNQLAGQTSDTILGAGTDTMDFAEQWNLFQNKMNTLVAPAAEKVFGLIGEGMTWINENAVPALDAFIKQWESGTGKGGEFRAIVADVGQKIKDATGFVIRHRETIKTLTVGILGGVVAFKALQGVIAGVRFAMAVANGVAAAYAATKKLLTAASIGSRLATVRETAAMVAHRAIALASAAASKVVAAGQWLVNAAMRANPIGLVITALTALVGGLIYAYKNSETFRRIVNAAWDGIKRGAQAAWNWLKPNVIQPLWGFFGTTLPNAFRTFVRVHQEAWTGIKSKANEVWGWLKSNVINPQVNFFTKTLPNAFSSFKNAFSSAWSGINSAAAKPVNFVIGTVYNQGLRKALNLIPGVNLGEAKGIPGFRTGGYTGNLNPDHVAGVVHGKEYVLTEQETTAMGGPGGVRSWLRTALGRGYKGGGYVWPTNSRALSGNYAGHSGVDVAVPIGSPLYAVGNGQISYTGWGRGYGNAIFMIDSNGVPWVYGHGSRPLVSAGQAVSRGQLIGYSGNTGRSTGPHLHIEAARGGFAAAGNRSYTLGLLGGTAIPAGGGGGGGSPFDLLTEFPKLITGVRGKLSELSNSPWGRVLKAGVSGIVDFVKQWGLNKIKGVGDAIWSGAKQVGSWVMGRGGAGNAYALGTLSAQPGIATVGERGPELVIGKQARMMRGGERVFSSSETRGLFGDSGRLRIIDGTFRIDEDSRVWVRGIAEDVVDDHSAGAARRARA